MWYRVVAPTFIKLLYSYTDSCSYLFYSFCISYKYSVLFLFFFSFSFFLVFKDAVFVFVLVVMYSWVTALPSSPPHNTTQRNAKCHKRQCFVAVRHHGESTMT